MSIHALRAALVIAVVSTVACGGGTPPPAAGGPPGGMAMPVELQAAAPSPVEQATEFVGAVKSRQSTTLQPQAEGFLTRILVKAGDRVSAGAPLFEIDSASQQALVANLESVRAAREADLSLARQRAQRAKALLDAGAGTQQDLESASAALQTAEAQLKSLDEQIRQQKNELGYYRVTAPVSGTLGDIPVRAGDRVTRATKLTSIESAGGLEIYISVPVQQAPRLSPGLPVEVIVEGRAATTREKVTFIAPNVDDTTQTVLVKAAVTATTGLRTDQFVRTRLIWSTASALTVPITAVLRVAGQQFVYVAVPGKNGGYVAQQRAIAVGDIVGNAYVVRDGIKAGEQVVVGGIQKIGDGMPIAAKGPAAPEGGQ